MDNNSGAGLKGPFVWTGQRVEGQISPIHDTPKCCHAHTHKHTLTCTHIRISGGTFPAFVAEADLGEFNLGCANFSQRGQGWRWRLCVGVCEGKRERERKTKRKSSLF